MTASRLEIAPGQLPAGSSKYAINLVAAKGARNDTDTTSLRVLAGSAPTGTIRCACLPAACRAPQMLACRAAAGWPGR